jgi:hypothetical protein
VGNVQEIPVGVDQRARIIDEYGEACRKCDEFKPTLDLKKKLSDQIQSWYEKDPAAQEAIAYGNRYSVIVSEREQESEVISIAKVRKHFGVRLFDAICTVPLGVLRKHLDEADYPKYIKTEQTGKRRLKPVLRSIVADEKQAA